VLEKGRAKSNAPENIEQTVIDVLNEFTDYGLFSKHGKKHHQ
jgi:hypothetical protein